MTTRGPQDDGVPGAATPRLRPHGDGEAQEKSGDLDGSRATYRRALEQAERSLGTPPPRPAPDRLPKGVFTDANGKVIPPDRTDPALRPRDDLLAKSVKFRQKLGDLAAAVETFKSITGQTERGWAATDIAEARSKAGDAEGALAWALALEPPSVTTWALSGLAAGTLAGR